MCKHSLPPGYQRKQEKKHPKLGDHISTIEEILKSDLALPRKQRHTAKRLYDRLKEEYGYEGGYDAVRRYVQEHKPNNKEVYIPLEHIPGTAQCDFGEGLAIIGNKEVKVHYIVMTLGKSRDIFTKAYYTEDQTAWCDGHSNAFEYFGGVPNKIIYDNSTCLVKKIHKYGNRELTSKFSELKSHYLFEGIFANPAKGNEKGVVEGSVGYVRKNFFVPLPRYKSLEEFNQYLRLKCEVRRVQKHIGHNKSIEALLLEEREVLLPLPQHTYESCDMKILKVNSCSLVRYKTNDYSVPVAYAYKNVTFKAYHDKVVIFYKYKEIASHERLYTRYDQSYNYLHYLPVLLRKTRALDQAKPMRNLGLPEEFTRLRSVLEQRYKESYKGKREYIEVLQLLSYHGEKEVGQAIKEAFNYGVVTIDTIKQNLLKGKDTITCPLDAVIPEALNILVQAPCLDQYNSLLSGK